MRIRIPLLISVALLALCLAFGFQEVRAMVVLEAFDSPARNLGSSGFDLNFVPVDDYFPNFTWRTGYHHFKPIIPVDYSFSTADNEDPIASDTNGVVNSAVSTIPEFPLILVLLLFMATTALEAMMLKKRDSVRA
jgi:hypothetical protein